MTVEKWEGLGMPRYLAQRQMAYERAQRIKVAYLCSGVTLRELGQATGLSAERVRQIICKAGRLVPPVVIWMGHQDFTTGRQRKMAVACLKKLQTQPIDNPPEAGA